MSMILNGGAYSRTSGPTTTNYTWLARVKPSEDVTFKIIFWVGNSDDSAFHALAIAGADFNVYDGVNFATIAASQLANQEYSVFLRCQGTGATDLVGGYRKAGDTAWTTQALQGSSFTVAKHQFGNNPGAEPFVGRLSGAKMWSAVLSNAELMEESKWQCALRTSNLFQETPMKDSTVDELDYSGNGRHWTVTGTPLNGGDPDIGWAPMVPMFQFAGSVLCPKGRRPIQKVRR